MSSLPLPINLIPVFHGIENHEEMSCLKIKFHNFLPVFKLRMVFQIVFQSAQQPEQRIIQLINMIGNLFLLLTHPEQARCCSFAAF